jgi:catechol 2,3-dioxygenase-like lactoylglutathione lyase family enzyme
MQLHRGRLIDHLHLRVADLDASRRFYAAALKPLGLELQGGPDHFFVDELWVDRAVDEVSRVHLSFQAADEAQVRAFHAAALAAGGTDNGAPGPRPYHPGSYGAFVLDPDGNNIEATYHGPARRSAASVTFDF